MGIEGCDCSEFERREGYISCESLMAGQISSLKDKPMSRFLVEMDQREYEVIKIEEADLKAIKDKVWKELPKPLITYSLLALVVSIIGVYTGFRISNFPLFFLSNFIAGCVFGVIFEDMRMEYGGKKIRNIDDNRLARLQNKVTVLEDKIATENEFKEQFRVAKDFFKAKYDIYLGQRNRPITKVITHVHSTCQKA